MTDKMPGTRPENELHEADIFDDSWLDDWMEADNEASVPESDYPLPFWLDEDDIPIDRAGDYLPNHRDVDGVVHLLAVVEKTTERAVDSPADTSYELHYFRVLQHETGSLDHESYPVMPLKTPEDSPWPLPQLQVMLEEGDLEVAQMLAQHVAASHGFDFPDSDDLPPLGAPFAGMRDITHDETAELPSAVQMANDPETNVAAFEHQFADSAYHLLEPVDPTVNYSFEVMAADPWTLELTADKWWLDARGNVGHTGQTLKTYSLETMEWEREAEREQASMDRETLHRTYQEAGLEAAMRQAEAMAVEAGELDATRDDARLFIEGPPDRFTTVHEITLDAPAPGSWDELIERERRQMAMANTLSEVPSPAPVWRLDTVPQVTPDGESSGVSLVMTVFPDAHDPVPDFDTPQRAQQLEMARFATDSQAQKFEKEFRSYLLPGLLEGPELAEEVAKLEGLTPTWSDVNRNNVSDLQRTQDEMNYPTVSLDC